MAASPTAPAIAVGQVVPRGRQSDVVYYDPKRDLVVLGTAGTGKTTMAVLRAKYLAHPQSANHGPVLLVTYNNALARYLRHLVPGTLGDVRVETYARFARGYLNSIGRMPHASGILDRMPLRTMIAQAVATVAKEYPRSKIFRRDTGFFVDELAWISDMGISAEQDYLDADRIGRKVGLLPGFRSIVWRIRILYLELREKAGIQYDWHDLATAVREGLASDSRPRMYKHIVIDEGQDLSPEAIRSLVAAVQPGGTVSFFGDYHQQIYGQGLSWRKCGLNVRVIDPFRDNLRNTAQIARIAIAMSEMPHMTGDMEDLIEPIEPKAAGSVPTLLKCRSEAVEIAEVQRVAKDQAGAGTVAILARTWPEARAAVAGLRGARALKDSSNAAWDPSPGIYYGTYHAAKGLEFAVVILPFANTTRLPNPEAVGAYGTVDASSRDGKLLYVAVTRARAELLVTYTGEVTKLLPTKPDLWTELER
ncbi:UvrD-like helicase family protein [Lentzea atacamensis]|uniref:DNA 3'-5' helicase n=1 Tax=Lentzea atacamensis TaxID=531938 RepID=A0A316HX91_9PSEU|nr:UvrD-helicase domain-containing protein [Lentzea atacamensis]PWK84580.1 UvrD-like helicase family protein [Lentzea atacamensis]